ncbi:MAG: Choice-of-anchor protein [Bacteroidota bacterium]|nr:Choice-of-anchor protein [Bacteroidota bacterium]
MKLSIEILKFTAAAAVFALIILSSCSDDSNPETPGQVTVNPASLDFKVCRTNLSRTLNAAIENTGSEDVTVSLSIETKDGMDASAFSLLINEGKITIKKGKIELVGVQFLPTEEKSYGATLRINGNKTVDLKGSGSGSIVVYASVDTLNYGSVVIGNTVSNIANFENVSPDKIDFTAKITGADAAAFLIEGLTDYSMSWGAKESITVKFNPTASRQYKAALELGNYKNIALNGWGIAGAELVISPVSLDYQNCQLGSLLNRKVTIQNVTQQPMDIHPVLSDENGFKILYMPGSPLQPGVIDSVIIGFYPTSPIQYSAVLSFDSQKSKVMTIRGKGVYMDDLITGAKYIDFGYETAGNTSHRTLNIKNNTINTLTLKYLITTQDASYFTVNGNLSLPPLGSTDLQLGFLPDASRKYMSILRLTTSNNSNYDVPLSGYGIVQNQLNLESVNFKGSAPVIDGNIDAVWDEAGELSLSMKQVQSVAGDNRTFNGTIKSIYDNQYIYFLVTIEDPTEDNMPNKIVFKGGDPSKDVNWTINTNGQDGISFAFQMSSDVAGTGTTFQENGCYSGCHTTNNVTDYESGMFPDTKGAIDFWYWKAGTTNPQGFADDYFADAVMDKRQGDKVGGPFEYENWRSVVPYLPISISGGDNNGYDKSKYIWDLTSVGFDKSVNNPATGLPWAAGDIIPGWKLKIPENDFGEGYRGDVAAKGIWKNGKWTVEFRRLLNTKSTNGDDAVITPGNDLLFSIAYFENNRKYSVNEYMNLKSNPMPGHFSPVPYTIKLNFK